MNEIFQLSNNIFQNLELNIDISEEDIHHLFREEIYIEIYKIMFPLLAPNLDKYRARQANSGQKIQYLIDLLSTDILKMDLSHIKGDQIQKGNLQHVLNFLQLLYEVSKLYNEKKQDENQQQSKQLFSDEEIDNNQMMDGLQFRDDQHDQNQYDDEEEEVNSENQKSRISEVSKSKESSEIKRRTLSQKKKQSPNQQQKNLLKNQDTILYQTQKLKQGPTQKANLKEMSKDIFPQSQQKRILTKNPSIQKRPQSAISSQQQVQQEEDIELTESQIQQLAQQMDIQTDGRSLYDILADSIVKIKASLGHMHKIEVPEEKLETQDRLIRQRNEYKHLLKEYLNYYKQNEQKQGNDSNLTQKNFLKKLRIINNQNEQFQQQFEDEQKSHYYKVRDEKVNYLRKIHRIVFELEKRKILDEKKQYKEERTKRNEESRFVLESIENAYKDKIQILRERLDQQRKEKQIAQNAQKQVIQKIEKELKKEKQDKLEQLRELWRCEKEKFELLVKDDGLLEQKIMELYKKY